MYLHILQIFLYSAFLDGGYLTNRQKSIILYVRNFGNVSYNEFWKRFNFATSGLDSAPRGDTFPEMPPSMNTLYIKEKELCAEAVF